ncbi:Capsule polysaccharide biosynthesis protein [Bremerella volcania]|uniref:Capsule polysaccharide biosynthesis protein n=1 Tax=Bremerella volcania TaxID=2527984 RepID=A0A518C3C1_9BACT|nr:hypothetical protein [Bremerella volcania]QDU73684.1 Capsule polysaccharide biosynthesis protein [Bremerella volcania]
MSKLTKLVRSCTTFAKRLINPLSGDVVRHPSLRSQWQQVLANSPAVVSNLPAPTGTRVLFATSWGSAEQCLVLESIFAMALRLRGENPTMLRCDNTLPACEYNPNAKFVPPYEDVDSSHAEAARPDICAQCTLDSEQGYDALPIETCAFSDYAKHEDLARILKIVDQVPFSEFRDFTYRDIAVGEHAYATTVRVQRRGTLLDNPETRAQSRRFLAASIMVVDLMERLIEDLKPERVIAVHGVYVTHGTLCEVARKHDIPVVVYGTPLRKNSIWLSHKDTYHRTLITEPKHLWENLPLTPARRERMNSYIAGKRLGGREYAAYYKDSIDSPEAIRQELGLDDRPIVSLFTNVLWDAQLYFQYNAFDNMLDWLNRTITYFGKRDDVQLVVRIHPAEANGGRGSLPTNQPILAEIEREFPQLPANVKIIRPESKMNSYTLAEMSSAALIYGARMGVEIAMLGVPLIVAGETFNRGKGYSYDVESAEEYFELLDRVTELPYGVPDSIGLATKYAYHYFFKLMMDFPLYEVSDEFQVSGARLSFKTLDALLPGSCASLDTICAGIVDGETPFLHDELRDAA